MIPPNTNTYHGYAVFNSPEGLDKKQVNKIFTLFRYACRQSEDVRFVRMDIRFPKGFNEAMIEPVMIKFSRYFMQKIGNVYGKSYYMKAREQETKKKEEQDSGRPHFHYFVLLCGNPKRPYTEMLQAAEEMFCRYVEKIAKEPVQGLVNFCRKDKNKRPQKNGIKIKTGGVVDEWNFRDAFRWATYLAKLSTKGNRPKYKKNFTTSELPAKLEFHNWLCDDPVSEYMLGIS